MATLMTDPPDAVRCSRCGQWRSWSQCRINGSVVCEDCHLEETGDPPGSFYDDTMPDEES